MTKQDLADRGFVNGYRKFYHEFVIDALLQNDSKVFLELRGGSEAARIEMVIYKIEELDLVLELIDRRYRPSL